MTTPVPARAHANMSVAEREFTFDTLLAEFGEQIPDDAAANPPAVENSPAASTQWARVTRRLLGRPLAAPSAEALKLGGLVAIAILSLTLVFLTISR